MSKGIVMLIRDVAEGRLARLMMIVKVYRELSPVRRVVVSTS